jgi:hypothetical protein
LKSIDQPNLVEGGIKLVPVQKEEMVEKYGQNQTWWGVAFSLFLFFHQVAEGWEGWKVMAKSNLVEGGVNFVPLLSSGWWGMRRLKSIKQTKPGAGRREVYSSSFLRLVRDEKVEKYWPNQTWWWVALCLLLFFHQVA